MITDSVPWMESLGVSPEGIAFWVIAYWCEAEGTGAIKLKEFVEGMKDLGRVSCESLLNRTHADDALLVSIPTTPSDAGFRSFCVM